MVSVETSRTIFKKTIGSEKFERFSRTPLAMALVALCILVGPGAAILAINNIESQTEGKALFFTAEALTAPIVVGSIVLANIRSRRNRR